MKFLAAFIVRNYRISLLIFAAVCVLSVPVFALRMTEMPGELQTKIREPRERTISLKLPLLQPTYHWTFMSREDFLSGKLLLRIVRDDQANEIVIFENGQFSDGWEVMGLPPAPERGEIYFGFISTLKYLTAPGDRLELELTVAKDLPGIGALQTGTLPAGKYASKGTYSGLIDEYDTTFLAEEFSKEGKKTPDEQEALLKKLREQVEHKAFLESWLDQWPLKITSQKGWLPEERAVALRARLENLEEQQPQAKEEPPVVSAEPAVIDENSSRKYLWCWIALPVVGLFGAVLLVRTYIKP